MPTAPTGTKTRKFYRATVSYSFLVVASDETEAYRLAGDDAWDAFSPAKADIDVETEDSPREGDTPWGDNPDGLTVAQMKKEDKQDPWRVDESAGPVHWCERCLRNRVQVDWRKDEQLCPDCEAEEGREVV